VGGRSSSFALMQKDTCSRFDLDLCVDPSQCPPGQRADHQPPNPHTASVLSVYRVYPDSPSQNVDFMPFGMVLAPEGQGRLMSTLHAPNRSKQAFARDRRCLPFLPIFIPSVAVRVDSN